MDEPASGWIEAGAHHLPLRVYYEDTDAGGIVYHASYLRFAERGRTELLRAAGFDHRGLERDLARGFAVRRCSIDFDKPALLDDRLIVTSRPLRATGARLDLEQVVARAHTTLVRLSVQLVLIGPGLRPARVPASLRHAIARIVG